MEGFLPCVSGINIHIIAVKTQYTKKIIKNIHAVVVWLIEDILSSKSSICDEIIVKTVSPIYPKPQQEPIIIPCFLAVAPL